MWFAFKVAVLVLQRGGGGGGQADTGVRTIPHCLSRFDTQPQARIGTFEAKMAAHKSI